jgi:hypothetical protein
VRILLSVVTTRALVASFSLVLASTLGCAPTSRGVVVRGEGVSGEGQCHAVDLESIYEIEARDRELIVKGAVFGWDPRPEKMQAAERRYPLPQGLRWRTQPTQAWVAGEAYGTLAYLGSKRRVRLDQLPGNHGPVHVISMAVPERKHVVLVAAGDWKVGPQEKFWCSVTIRGEL